MAGQRILWQASAPRLRCQVDDVVKGLFAEELRHAQWSLGLKLKRKNQLLNEAE